MNFFNPWKKDIHRQIHALLKGKGINYENPDGNANVFVFHSDVDDHVVSCPLDVNLPANILTFVAYLRQPDPKHKHCAVYEYLVRINVHTLYGAFHLNPDDSLVKCATTLIIDKAEILYDQLERLCFNNMMHVKAFQMSIYGILNNDWTGLEAYQKVRNIKTGALN